MSLLPIRKVVAGLLATGVVYVLRKVAHIDIGSDTAADAVNVFLGWVIAYAVKDPRVKAIEREAQKLGLMDKLRLLDKLVREAAAAPPPEPPPAS